MRKYRVIKGKKDDGNKEKKSLHGTTSVSTRSIYNGINPHINTRHSRHRVHIRTRALAVYFVPAVTLLPVPSRASTRAAHAARVRMVVAVVTA